MNVPILNITINVHVPNSRGLLSKIAISEVNAHRVINVL